MSPHTGWSLAPLSVASATPPPVAQVAHVGTPARHTWQAAERFSQATSVFTTKLLSLLRHIIRKPLINVHRWIMNSGPKIPQNTEDQIK